MSETRVRILPNRARSSKHHLAVLAVGGFMGSGARILVGQALASASGDFPWATVLVNLVGAGLLGLFLSRRVSRMSVHFWAVGVLGSFTTFSTFSLEIVGMLEEGSMALALGYLSISIVGGLLAVIAGDRLGRRS